MRKYNRLIKIISGGQTGADQGGLQAAYELQIETGGLAPKGYLTEAGNIPSLLKDRYGLDEDTQDGYKHRTKDNVLSADGTVIFVEKTSPGSVLTKNFCVSMKKPYIISPTPEQFVDWLIKHSIKVLNVAGNRESVAPVIQNRTGQFMK